MGAPKLQKTEKSLDHEKVFLAHYGWLLDWARQLTQGSTHEAEDLVQDLYVRFVQAKASPDLADDDRLRGYLYRTLKHLFISRRLRNGTDALSSLLIVDFDSLEFAMSAVDRSRLLRVRSDLASICEYACARRANHRAASVLILRFFLGYFPTEIMGILQSSRAAIDKLTQTARLEARACLTKPENLHFIGQDRKRARVFPSYLPDDPEALYAELRRRIFSETVGPCLSSSEVAERYAKVSDTRVTTPEIAHLVSCRLCLDEANKVLGFPTLLQRFSSDGSEPRDGGPPPAASRDGKAPKLRRKLRETFEHRPAKLQIAVNGEVRAVQLITSPHSTFQIKLEPLARLEFVEVLSEQGVRLLYHNLESGDIGDPTAQLAEVELSDHRSLAVAITLNSGVSVVEVTYYDPLVEANATSVVLPAPANRPSAQVAVGKRSFLRWRSLFARSLDIDWHWPRSIGIAIAAVAVIAACLIISSGRREKTGASETAAALLAESQQNGDASIPSRGAMHRTFAFEVRSDKGDVIETGKVDTLRSREPSRIAIRLLGADGMLLAGRSVDGAGKATRYPLRRKHYRPADNPDPQPLFNDAWVHIPEPDEFERITGDPSTLSVSREDGGYELTYTRPRSSEGAGILQAQLVLKGGSLRPVAETLRVRDQEQTREYRFTELSYEVLPPNRVQDSDFTLDPSPVVTSSIKSGAPSATASSAHLVLQAFQLLNNLGPDVEDMVDIDRLPNGSVQISGVLPTQQQEAAVATVFGSLTPYRQLKLDLHSRDEPSPAVPAHKIQTVESLPVVAVQDGRIPLDAEVREGLSEQGVARENLDARIGEIAGGALDHAARMHREAWTIRQIAAHDLSVDELRAMPPDDRMLWLTLLDEHIRSLGEQLTFLDEDLIPLFQNGKAQSAAAPLPPSNLRELGAVVEVMNHDSERLDRLLTAGFTLSPSDIPPNPNVAEIAELLADLRIEESTLHETVTRLQAARP